MDVIFSLLRQLLPANAGNAISVFVAAVLTFMIFTYVVGDNLFFRIAQHMLIGTVAAYAVVVAVQGVLLDRLLRPLTEDPLAEWPLLIPLIFGILLWSKAWPEKSWLGNVPIGFMLGVGAALSISGALFGTLLPQLQSTAISLYTQVTVDQSPGEQLGQIISNIILVFGTLGALLSFHFVRGERHWPGRLRNSVLFIWGGAGRLLIWIAFGALFASLLLSRMTLLVGRVQFLLDAFRLSVR